MKLSKATMPFVKWYFSEKGQERTQNLAKSNSSSKCSFYPAHTERHTCWSVMCLSHKSWNRLKFVNINSKRGNKLFLYVTLIKGRIPIESNRFYSFSKLWEALVGFKTTFQVDAKNTQKNRWRYITSNTPKK